MLSLSVESTIKNLLNPLYQLGPKQYPYIVAAALTKTAQDVKAKLVEEMKLDLQNPLEYTQRGIFLKAANRQTLEATLDMATSSFGKGIPAGKYMRWQVYGGARTDKRFEAALRARGVLPQGLFAVPSKTMPLDGYGNVAMRGIYRQVLSALGASDRAADQNQTARSKAKGKRSGKSQIFFVNREGQRLPMGIYARTAGRNGGKRIDMLFAFVRQPQYKPRYSFYETAQANALNTFPQRLNEATASMLSKMQGW